MLKLCSDSKSNTSLKEDNDMSSNNSSNKLVVPGAREAMDKFKMEAANDFHVKLHIKRPLATLHLIFVYEQSLKQ